MAHLLMIESWVGASGKTLPPLIRSMGHTYTFVTRKPSHYRNPHSDEDHAVFRYAQEVIETETNDVGQILKSIQNKSYDGVITVCDYYIETVCAVAKFLDIPCPFSYGIKNTRQKHLMRQAIDKAALSNIKYQLAHSWGEVKKSAETIGYPLVTKPVDLASSAFVKLIKTENELHQAFTELEAFPLNFRDQPRDCTYLIEEFLEGQEVSVESISYNGETVIVGITDKSVTGEPYFIENGHMFPADLSEKMSLEITTYVAEVLKAVGYAHGIGHTEVKLTKKGPRIIEINPRTAGNYIVELVERVTGVNLLRAFVQLSLGEKPDLTAERKDVKSAAIMFYVPQRGGKIEVLSGEDTIKANPHIVRYKIEDCIGKTIEKPIDNACYLGHFVTEDTQGYCARRYAEEALSAMKVGFSSDTKGV